MYTVNNVVAGDAASYSVVVSGTCGTITSTAAVLSINTPITISTQPVNTTVCDGTTATLSVVAGGTGATYQWHRVISAGTVTTVAGAVSSTFTTTTAGTYYVVVGGACGSVTSGNAVVTVNTNTAIVTAPVNATACAGTSASFSVTAVGTNLTYQWYAGTTTLTGATSSVLSLNNVTTANAGTYRVVVLGACSQCGYLLGYINYLECERQRYGTELPVVSEWCCGRIFYVYVHYVYGRYLLCSGIEQLWSGDLI
jgi:hypothetical protein